MDILICLPLDSGVGLELTKRLVELHKGHISVESKVQTTEQDAFTRFTLLLVMRLQSKTTVKTPFN